MVIHTYIPSIREAGARRLLQIWGQPGEVHDEFRASQGYVAETFFENKNKSESYWSLWGWTVLQRPWVDLQYFLTPDVLFPCQRNKWVNYTMGRVFKPHLRAATKHEKYFLVLNVARILSTAVAQTEIEGRLAWSVHQLSMAECWVL